MGAGLPGKKEKLQFSFFNHKKHFGKEYLAFFKDYENLKYLNRPEYMKKINPNLLKEYIDKISKSKNDIMWAVHLNKELVATVKLGQIDYYNGYCDLGIMIGNKKYRGKGFAKIICKYVINYAFNKLNLRRIEGSCISKNIAMNKTFKNLGFKLEGQMIKRNKIEKRYFDRNIYALFRKKK